MSLLNINEFKMKAKKDVRSRKSATKRKKTQPSEETKEPSTEECTTVISPKSISIIGEQIGISELPGNVCNELAEDVSNKLREVVNNCSILLRNNKRRTLLAHDVNQVFETSTSLPIYGHSFPNGHDFLYIHKKDIFIPEDAEMDIVTLALSNTSLTTPGDEHIKGSWILPDPVEESDPQVGTSSSSNSCSADPQAGTSSSSNSCNVKNSTTTSTTTLSNNTTIVSTLPKQRRKYSIGSGTSVPQEKATKPPETSAKPEDTVNKLPAHLMNYYLEIAEIIIVNNNENLLRVALKDLRTNPKIAPLCPYFLNLVAISVLEFQGNGRLLDALIRTVDALVDNPYFDPSSHLATNRGLTALVNIATGPHVAKGWDDMLLRRQSATILGKVMNHWVIEQKQQENLVRRLSDLMFRGTYVSLKSHFGAVVILSTFGDRVLNTEFWPQIHHYFNLLDNLLNFDTAEDIHFVKGAILMAAEGMLKRFHYAAHTTNKEVKRLQDVSNQLYEYFGDTLIPWFYLKVLGTSVYPPVVTVPVERKLPIFRKENMRFDHDYCFKSCNYVIILQHQLQLTYTLNILGTALVQKPKIDTNSVFAVEPWHSKTLRKKNLDNTQNYYDNRVHKFPQMWYRQTIFKCTRTIKNCLPSHKKSGAGDLFMLI